MFNNPDFYPTPSEVIQKMVGDLDLFNKIVLEPSAGSGNILKYVRGLGANTLACEKDEKLAKIIQSECDEFLGYDFLEVIKEQVSHIDCIIMNPPFSADEKHILHAWEIAPEGCIIKALCNWETVDNNSFSRHRRQLTDIISKNGYSEYLGDCFSTSERKTNVNIGLVVLHKPQAGNNEFDGYFDLSDDHEKSDKQGLVTHNEITEIVNRYIGAVKMFDQVEEISNQINTLAAPFNAFNSIKFGAHDTSHDGRFRNVTREVYKKQLQKSAWKSVFSKLNMDKYVTQGVLEKLNKFVEKQTNVPFKLSNVFKMVDMIYQTYEENMNLAIIDIFEKLTNHSSQMENRHYIDSWKTNEHYLIGKKFIMPSVTEVGYHGEMNLRYNGNYNKINDLTKSLCFLTGTKWDDIGDFWNMFRKAPKEWGKWYDWGFFEFKCYKKGTSHFKFKDENDWALLNQRIAKIKGWQLPNKF
tara:strand:- start:350 stop:1753 length:1404 start_codon:yes stop_codon:yes gene_type:complete